MFKIIFHLLLISVVFSACSVLNEALDEGPEPGRCSFHTDCLEGQKCHNTFCEDLYYPKRDIQTY